MSPPQVGGVNEQKTISLHEALGLASPPSWESKVAHDQSRSTESAAARGATSASSSRQHGTHALYRACFSGGGPAPKGRGVLLSAGGGATRGNGGGKGVTDSVGDSHAVASSSRAFAASGGDTGISMPSPGNASSRADSRRVRVLTQDADAVSGSLGGLAGVPSAGERVGVVNTCSPQGGGGEKARNIPSSDGEGGNRNRDNPAASLKAGNLAGGVVKAEPMEKAMSCAGFTWAEPEDFVRAVANVHAELTADRDKRGESDGNNATGCATVDPALAPSPLELSTAEPSPNSRGVASGVATASSTAAPIPSVGNAAGEISAMAPPVAEEASALAAPAASTEAEMRGGGSAERHTGDAGRLDVHAAVVDGVPGIRFPSGGGGGPARKRRKSGEGGRWRARYNADEFESGDALALRNASETEPGMKTAAGVEQGRGGRAQDGGMGEGGGVEEEESDGDVVDVGGGDGGDMFHHENNRRSDEAFPGSGLEVVTAASGGYSSSGAEKEAGGGGSVGGDGGTRRRRRRASKDKKGPPNAWKRRCATGNCHLGASFGQDGHQAVYCSSHKDSGMVNVTHRRCESPG